MAGIDSLNENLCVWVHGLLQPLGTHIRGYLQDSRQVLSAFCDFQWDDHFGIGRCHLSTVIPHGLALGIWLVLKNL